MTFITSYTYKAFQNLLQLLYIASTIIYFFIFDNIINSVKQLYIKTRDCSKYLNLADKTILITGCANGIGYKTTFEILKLKNPPKKVILWDIEESEFQTEKFQRNYPKTKIFFKKIDLKNVNIIEDAIVQENCEIDIFIAIAGYMNRDFFTNLTFQQFENVLKVNFLANVKITQVLLKGRNNEALHGTLEPKNSKISFNVSKIIYISSVMSKQGLATYS